MGWKITLVGFFAAFALGGVVGIALLVLGKGGRKTKVPFGPYLIAGALIGLLQGAELARLWLGDTF
jgi:leader peptidase (prepilin peptidase)/N-methyltransferase